MRPLLPDLASLSLKELVAQMVIVRASGFLFDHQIQYPVWEPPNAVLQSWLQEWGVGGVILLGGSAGELALRTQQLREWAKVPLLIAADIEEGVGQRFSGATWFPPPMALNAIAQTNLAQAITDAEQMGSVTAQEALAIGLNWVLAPVVDVNNNPDNPVINVRAFGETPDVVSQLATAFIRGAHCHPVLTSAKHFPGHGDTAVDSHLDLPVIPHSLERLNQTELPPFQAAIAAGVDTIMSAHLRIPALDQDNPATLSERILTQLLRKQLGFEGLIVTDALVMGAIANHYGKNEAAVLAVEAGADILLMPADPIGAIEAVCEAVETGRIPVERVQSSVERIWQAKQKVCALSTPAETPHAWDSQPVGLEARTLTTQLAQPEAMTVAEDILRDAMQVYTPVLSRQYQEQDDRCNLILIDDALHCDFLGRQAPAIVLPEAQGYHLQVVDANTSSQVLGTLKPQPTLLQLFIRGNPFRGSAGLTQTAQSWLRFLLDSNQLQALVIYGSPYALDQFRAKLPPDLPYIFTYGQMPQAQEVALKILFNQMNSQIAQTSESHHSHRQY